MEDRLQSQVNIPLGRIILKGDLYVPLKASAIVIFSHGSGSSRLSKRNKEVAERLNEKKLGTLLFDLLTEEEDREYSNRFDIDLLTQRLIGTTQWLEKHPVGRECQIGYFGASTGAASAIKAAARLPEIRAVVSRGGRPDLAVSELHDIKAPTLLIVGSLDYDVLELNRQAMTKLNCIKKLELVEGATHLFEEPGKMEVVSKLAADWFEKYLIPGSNNEYKQDTWND
jgi:dienelactone hydrolase